MFIVMLLRSRQGYCAIPASALKTLEIQVRQTVVIVITEPVSPLGSKGHSFSNVPLRLSVLPAFHSHLCCDSSPWFYFQILGAANAQRMPLALSLAMFSWAVVEATL